MDKKKDTGVLIAELCERFRNRGIAEKVQSDANALAEKSQRVRMDNKDSYIDGHSPLSPKNFRTGNDAGVAYMTSDDFLRYYRSLRSPAAPAGKSREDAEYEKASRPEEVKPQSKKERRLAIKKLIAQRLKGAVSLVKEPRESARRLIDQTNKGFPEDKPENRARAEAKKLPAGVLPLTLCVMVSLFLIVCSSVMVSRAKSDVAALEMKISELEQEKSRLKSELDIKNNLIDIRDIATNQYGMVGIEYVESKYIYIEREDKIELPQKSMCAAVELLRSANLKNSRGGV